MRIPVCVTEEFSIIVNFKLMKWIQKHYYLSLIIVEEIEPGSKFHSEQWSISTALRSVFLLPYLFQPPHNLIF